jgi:transposase InsO family protein
MIQEKAKRKYEIIIFFRKHGLEATMDAFRKSKSSIYSWDKRFRESSDDMISLNEKPRVRNNQERRSYHYKIIEFIGKIREKRRFGKDKIKLFLDNFCDKEGFKKISVSTIGRIIKDKDMTIKRKFTPSGRETKKPSKIEKLRRKDHEPEKLGEIEESDTIERYKDSIKRYIRTCIDEYSGFAFAYAYKTKHAINSKDLYLKYKSIAPFKIEYFQTDNGREFYDEFHRSLKEDGVKHYWNYKRKPYLNGHVERFNRTLEEEFLVDYEYLLFESIDEFNKKLLEWLVFYNTERPHWSLKLRSPLQFIIQEELGNIEKNHNSSNLTPEFRENFSKMRWTETICCFRYPMC